MRGNCWPSPSGCAVPARIAYQPFIWSFGIPCFEETRDSNKMSLVTGSNAVNIAGKVPRGALPPAGRQAGMCIPQGA